MRKNLKYFMIAALAFMVASCIKNDYTKLGTTGTSSVRLGETPENILFFSPFSNVENIDLITVRRDEVSAADVNKSLTITVANRPDSIDAYNDENDQNYETMPDSLYTLITSGGVTQTGNNYSVTFAPGVTAVTISIQLNGAKWDVSHSYAFYFVISDAGGKAITIGEGEALTVVASKNAYDGKFSCVAGAVQRYTDPTTQTTGDALNGSMAGNPDVTLSTVGPYTVEISNLRWAGGASGIAGINNLQATVDPLTNLVTMKALGNATLANVDGLENSYDPDTQTFTLNFQWNPTANKRTVLGLVLKYKGPR